MLFPLRRPRVLLLLSLLPHALPSHSWAAPLKAEAGGIAVEVSQDRGIGISVDGVPFSSESKFYVVKPGWTGRLFGWEDSVHLEQIVRESLPQGGVRLTVPLEASGTVFSGRKVLEVTPDRRLRIALEGELAPDVHGHLESRIASIQPGWIVGRTLTIEADGQSTTVAAPTVASSEEVRESKLADSFSSLTLNSRLGPVTIMTSGTLPVSLVDYRRNKWAAGKEFYWFGVLDTKVESGKPVRYEVTFQFPPPPRDLAALTARAAGVVSAEKALLPEQKPDLVIPTPKRISWRSGNVLLAEKLEEAGGGSASSPSDTAFADLAQGDREELERFCVQAKRSTSSLRPEGCDSPHWYRLSVDPQAEGRDSVAISAETSEGISLALKTLRQLVRYSEGQSWLRGCEITDWPELPFRGIHFFSGHRARDLQLRMVNEILGPLKINALVYQVDYLRWESMPEGSHKARYVMEKRDAGDVADAARAQGIEVIPMVNTFGHSEWLLANDKLRHLADDPGRPYAYDPSNPEVYRLCEAIYEEAIELFRPRIFHIGHDEVTIFGFPQKEVNKRAGESELIIRDILHYYNWLKKRGLRTAMWGDMLLGPGEAGPDACLAPSDEVARHRRDALPRDILITDWHYEGAPVEKFTSLELLNRAGFDTVASTWYDPKNIVRFARRAKLEREEQTSSSGTATSATSSRINPARARTLGLLQTTWAGYSFDETSFLENPDQYAAYLLAAEAAWNGGYTDPEAVPYDYRVEFARLWNRRLLPAGEAAGWTLPLPSAGRMQLAPDKAGRFLGSPVAAGPDFFPLEPGLTPVSRYLFQIPAGDKGVPEALLLQARFNPAGQDWPASWSADLGTTASAVVFALGATFPGPTGLQIAESEITYADGTTLRLPWKLEQTVFPLTDTRATPLAQVIWKRAPRSAQDPGLAIRSFVWKNPRPEKELKSLTFRSANRGSGLVVFGVTGVQ